MSIEQNKQALTTLRLIWRDRSNGREWWERSQSQQTNP